MADILKKILDAKVLLAVGLLLAFISGATFIGPALANIVTPAVVAIGKLLIVVAAVIMIVNLLQKK